MILKSIVSLILLMACNIAVACVEPAKIVHDMMEFKYLYEYKFVSPYFNFFTIQ